MCLSFTQSSPEIFQGHNISIICPYIWNLFFMKTIHNIEKYFNQFHVNLSRKVFFSFHQVFHCSFLCEKLASSLSSTTLDILKDDSNKGIFGEGHHIRQGPFLPPSPPHMETKAIYFEKYTWSLFRPGCIYPSPPTCAGL